MTPQELAKLQRDFLILTEKRSAVALDAEFDSLKSEISLYLRSNLTKDTTRAAERFIDEIIALLNVEAEKFARSASSIVASAQRGVINFAGGALKEFFPRLGSSIFSPDAEAVQKLIGRMQTGKSLLNYFRALKPHIAEQTRQALIEGFAAGDSSSQIVNRIGRQTGGERFRILTVSRNETVMAYRNASLSFYKNAGISEYRFISSLDVRTCLICWRLHGTTWKLKTKPHIHTQCRCVVSPVLKNEGQIKTGIELFNNLEKGVQKQILGRNRFELFENGTCDLSDFTGIKKSEEFGNTHFLKPLNDLKQS